MKNNKLIQMNWTRWRVSCKLAITSSKKLEYDKTVGKTIKYGDLQP